MCSARSSLVASGRPKNKFMNFVETPMKSRSAAAD
jgi:hypothetical protein